MAKNFVQDGNVVTLTAPTGGVVAGGVMIAGSLIGVSTYDAPQATDVEVALTGVYELPKATGTAINLGAQVWWSTGSARVEASSAAGRWPIGAATKAAGSSDTTVRVRLPGIPVVAASS
jgi:predicted RecA/RadA family phage recombinase